MHENNGLHSKTAQGELQRGTEILHDQGRHIQNRARLQQVHGADHISPLVDPATITRLRDPDHLHPRRGDAEPKKAPETAGQPNLRALRHD